MMRDFLWNLGGKMFIQAQFSSWQDKKTAPEGGFCLGDEVYSTPMPTSAFHQAKPMVTWISRLPKAKTAPTIHHDLMSV